MTLTDDGDKTRLVTVCAECLTALCWHGEIMCDKAQTAGTVDKTVAELDALQAEHPSHYSRKKVAKVCGANVADRRAQ